MGKFTVAEIRDYFESNSKIIVPLMIAASENGRPAVEPLQGRLQHHFGRRLYLKGFRAWVGRVAQEVTEKNGYKRNGDERKEVKGNEFGRAACFKKC